MLCFFDVMLSVAILNVMMSVVMLSVFRVFFISMLSVEFLM